MSDSILGRVAEYYAGKLRAHGPTPAGVDWNSEESQRLRFQKLLEVARDLQDFSILDYGCGYGALLGHLKTEHPRSRYVGYDISEDMIARARELHGSSGAEFHSSFEALTPQDFTVASGVFNVRLDVDTGRWVDYVHATIDRLNGLSLRGFAFNVLTSYSDPPRMRADLYYADPLVLFDRCKRLYSKQVALLHDYPLYEFTIIVRK